MKVLAIISISFWLGAAFGRWDALHGSETGERWGKATREFLNLPPIEKKD